MMILVLDFFRLYLCELYLYENPFLDKSDQKDLIKMLGQLSNYGTPCMKTKHLKVLQNMTK